MKNVIINVKSDRSLKQNAENYAQELGLSLSDLVNLALRYVVTVRSVVLDTRPTPNLETTTILKEVARDIKVRRNLSPRFKTSKEAFSWLEKQIS